MATPRVGHAYGHTHTHTKHKWSHTSVASHAFLLWVCSLFSFLVCVSSLLTACLTDPPIALSPGHHPSTTSRIAFDLRHNEQQSSSSSPIESLFWCDDRHTRAIRVVYMKCACCMLSCLTGFELFCRRMPCSGLRLLQVMMTLFHPSRLKLNL